MTGFLRLQSPAAVSLSCRRGVRSVQIWGAMPEFTDWNFTCAPVFGDEAAGGQQRFQSPGHKARAPGVTVHCARSLLSSRVIFVTGRPCSSDRWKRRGLASVREAEVACAPRDHAGCSAEAP